jgi:hypothetical protein
MNTWNPKPAHVKIPSAITGEAKSEDKAEPKAKAKAKAKPKAK